MGLIPWCCRQQLLVLAGTLGPRGCHHQPQGWQRCCQCRLWASAVPAAAAAAVVVGLATVVVVIALVVIALVVMAVLVLVPAAVVLLVVARALVVMLGM